jgi:hypothetical protein
MIRTYCTLFDKNYLYQGVALYQSLVRHAGDFNLYVLCMDDVSYSVLYGMKLDNLTPVRVEDILTPTLEEVRGRTSHGQFCWVCQPIICQYVLEYFHADMVTYLEADSLFFFSPEPLFEEMGAKSISLVPHNYSAEFNNSKSAGIYCTQFNAFRNDASGLAVLEYWKEWCYKYNKSAPLEYPGQTNLDNWPNKFEDVCVIQNVGAGVAPWNVSGYELTMENLIPHVNGLPVVFYHYHQYGRFTSGDHQLCNYPLSQTVIDFFYRPYIAAMREAEMYVHAFDPQFSYRREYASTYIFANVLRSLSVKSFKEYLSNIKNKIRGRYNIYPDTYFEKSKEDMSPSLNKK